MSSADITALRADACKVFAELGMALACIEDVAGLTQHEGATISALTHERMQGACSALESASAHLADLATAADQIALKLAPQGVH